jgi:hypothetical protein
LTASRLWRSRTRGRIRDVRYQRSYPGLSSRPEQLGKATTWIPSIAMARSPSRPAPLRTSSIPGSPTR